MATIPSGGAAAAAAGGGSSAPSVAASALPLKLNWRDRPETLQKRIDSAFASVSSAASSEWGLYNGAREGYFLCGIDEFKLMESIVRKAPADQTDFYALDIGCGNFQWGGGLASHMDRLTDLPRPIKVHIVSVRGEKYLGDRVIETKRCRLYKLGAFKIEELFDQFTAHGFDLENKVDLVVSRWTFRHLADPVGTFTQAYDLLRPGSGILSTDGFFMLEKGDLAEISDLNLDYNGKMRQLFAATTAPFVSIYRDLGRTLDHFLLQRPNSKPCELPMKYEGCLDVGGRWQNDSNCMTIFTRKAQESDSWKLVTYERLEELCPRMPLENIYRGDKGLYEHLKRAHGIGSGAIVPFYTSELPKSLPALQNAVMRKDKEALKAALDAGHDVNESDLSGSTAAYLAVETNQLDLLELLLEKGADPTLPNGKGENLLHVAARWDTDGRFLRRLLTFGMDVNCKTSGYGWGKTPFCIAMRPRNQVVMRILLDAGASIKPWEEDLIEPAFEELHSHPALKAFVFIKVECPVLEVGDTLELRGEATGLSWDEGATTRKNTDNTWRFLVDASRDFPYKVVIKKPSGEIRWETGDNHLFKTEEPHPLRTVSYTPVFA